MTISIILPTCDRESLLKRALQSVFAQSAADWELIVVNDGTRELSEEFRHINDSRVRWLRTSGRLGVSAARNTGIAASSGEWLAFLDDDDELLPDFLARMLPFAREHGLDLAWCGTRLGERGPDRLWDVSSEKSDSLRFIVQIAASCGLMIRRAVVDTHGGFDTGLRTSEDRELLFRLVAAGCRYAALPEALVRVHDHEGPRLSNVRHDPARAIASGRDDELLLQRYAPLLSRDPVLLRDYYYALAGKFFHGRNPDGFWRVYRSLPLRWRFNRKLLLRALRMWMLRPR